MTQQRPNKTRKRRRLKQDLKSRRRRAATYVVLIVLLTLGLILIARSCQVDALTEEQQTEKTTTRIFATPDDVTFNGNYSSTFKDLQDVQILAAEKYGIDPQPDASAIDSLVRAGALMPVTDCIYYETEEVTLPYLVPAAKDLLDEIGRRYHEREKDIKQLRLTSCLRTDEAIRKLMRGNRNSVKNSCHLYGTTMDISYRYLTQAEKRTLAQVLLELQQGGYCYVKYEYKQPCFHITVRMH